MLFLLGKNCIKMLLFVKCHVKRHCPHRTSRNCAGVTSKPHEVSSHQYKNDMDSVYGNMTPRTVCNLLTSPDLECLL